MDTDALVKRLLQMNTGPAEVYVMRDGEQRPVQGAFEVFCGTNERKVVVTDDAALAERMRHGAGFEP